MLTVVIEPELKRALDAMAEFKTRMSFIVIKDGRQFGDPRTVPQLLPPRRPAHRHSRHGAAWLRKTVSCQLAEQVEPGEGCPRGICQTEG